MKGDSKMNFADRLQELRKAKGFSQEDLAESLNVSRQSVSKWETGLGYPETEKLLILCEVLGVDLDYLLRDKLREHNAEPITQSPYIQYLKKWVKLYLNDKEFNGFYCIAIIEIGKDFLAFIDDKGKVGLLNIICITSISEADTHKYKALPKLSDAPSEILKTLPKCFDRKLCTIRLRQEAGFTKQGALSSVHINAITGNQITASEQNGKMCTVIPSDVLYIKEQ